MADLIRRAAAASVLPILLLAAGCDAPVEPQVPPGASGMPRTLSILKSRPTQDPNVLRVLFYGQSISTPKWTDMAASALQRRFPNTRLVVGNLAIGGFAAQLLERTVARDVAAFYPDLIVFHVYGDHRAYERIIRTMRSTTAAEIIVQNDHVIQPVEPVCDEGLHLAWTPPPGCHGHVWFRQRSWEQHMSSSVLPRLAREYGLVLEDRRPLWNAYLRRHGLQPQDLLADGLHPNATGWKLIAKLWVTFMERQVAAYRGERSTLVTSLPAPTGAAATPIEIDGNRVELIANGPLDGQVDASVDGRPPQDQDGCWQDSRVDGAVDLPDWPLIRQVNVTPQVHRTDRWTVTITPTTEDPRRFAFDLVSARRGPEGSGNGDSDFTSRSGEVKIAAQDWTIPSAYDNHAVVLPAGYKASWQRSFVCRDTPAINLRGEQVEVRHVVATGMTNGRHVITLKLTPEARQRVREIRVYRPPLNEDAAA